MWLRISSGVRATVRMYLLEALSNAAKSGDVVGAILLSDYLLNVFHERCKDDIYFVPDSDEQGCKNPVKNL